MGGAWEVVDNSRVSGGNDLLDRRQVPGGWIYRNVIRDPNGAEIIAMVFVPNPTPLKRREKKP